jgi:4a-hydroxytetrahydrobiopterin dehydratase
MSELSSQSCIPCGKGEPPASEADIREHLQQIPEWTVVEREGISQLERTFKFKDFAGALQFTNKVGEAAEAEDHHPSLLTEWGKVTVTWWTHVLNGLHRNDFIMAARTDQIYAQD